MYALPPEQVPGSDFAVQVWSSSLSWGLHKDQEKLVHILPNLAVGVLAWYGLSCSQHGRTGHKGCKVTSSPGFSPYNLCLNVFSYEFDHVSGYSSEKIASLLTRHWVSGVGAGCCLVLTIGRTPQPRARVILLCCTPGLTQHGGSTARAGLWYAWVLPCWETERWNLICKQNRKESGFPPEIKKKNSLNFASTSSSTFKSSTKTFQGIKHQKTSIPT